MILITGANGLMGRALSQELLATGAQLRLQVRNPDSLTNSLPQPSRANADIVKLDLDGISFGECLELVKGCTTVIHTAGLVHNKIAPLEDFRRINVFATQELARACRQSGVDTFIFFSTSAVYGSAFNGVTESSSLQPETPYAQSKFECEQFLQQNPCAKRTLIFRPSLIFGEGDRGNMISLVRQINSGRYFHLDHNPARKSIIYSRDAAAAVVSCMNKVEPGFHIFNLTNPQQTSVVELAETISQCLGRRGALPSLPQGFVKLGAQVAERLLGKRTPLTVSQLDKLTSTTTCSVNKLVGMTSFSPTYTLQQALRNEIAWARSEGLL